MHSKTQKALRQFRGDNVYKEADVSLSTDDINAVIKRVFEDMGIQISTEEEYHAFKTLSDGCLNKVFTQYPTGLSSSDLLYAFKKELEAQIKDVTQPHGGTDKLTNTQSPGMAPAKDVAEPGSSEYDEAGSPVPADSGFYSIRGRFSSSKYSEQPGATFNPVSDTTRAAVPHLSHGPVSGEFPSYDDRPAPSIGNRPGQYAGWSTPSVPELKRPEGKVGKTLLRGTSVSLYKTRDDAKEVTYDEKTKQTRVVKIIAPATKPVVGLDVATTNYVKGLDQIGNVIVGYRKQAPAEQGIPSQAAAPEGYVQDDALFEQAAALDTAAMSEERAAREAELAGSIGARDIHREQAKTYREQAFALRKSVTTGSLTRWLKLLERKS